MAGHGGWLALRRRAGRALARACCLGNSAFRALQQGAVAPGTLTGRLLRARLPRQRLSGQQGGAVAQGVRGQQCRSAAPCGARGGAPRSRLIALAVAGLSAALGLAACSSATVAPPEPTALDAPAGRAEPEPHRAAPAAPAAALRKPQPYDDLWKAAAAYPPSGATLDGAESATDPANPPDAPPGAPYTDDTDARQAQSDRHWSQEDLAELEPYLQGIASWYGPNFHGKPTANGETYNQFGLTAAHPVLPIGTLVLVENLDNGRKVWLRINDRGPYAKGRILDLSRLAAERLGMIAQGTAPVRITVLKWPDSVQPSLGLKPFQQYTVQSAAYPELERAESLRERLQARFPELPFFVAPASNGFFAVSAGPFDDEGEARQVSRRIHRSGLSPLVRRFRN